MAFHAEYQTIPGLVANSTGLASSQYCIVKLASTAGQCVLGATSVMFNSTVVGVYGVLQNAPAGAEPAEMAVSGIVKVKVGQSTAIAIGADIGSNSTSLAVDRAATDNASVLGRALTASSAANDIITVLLTPGGWRY